MLDLYSDFAGLDATDPNFVGPPAPSTSGTVGVKIESIDQILKIADAIYGKIPSVQKTQFKQQLELAKVQNQSVNLDRDLAERLGLLTGWAIPLGIAGLVGVGIVAWFFLKGKKK